MQAADEEVVSAAFVAMQVALQEVRAIETRSIEDQLWALPRRIDRLYIARLS